MDRRDRLQLIFVPPDDSWGLDSQVKSVMSDSNESKFIKVFFLVCCIFCLVIFLSL